MFEHRPLEIFELKEEYKDGKRFYKVSEELAYPSVTTVLSTLSKEGIQKWVDRVGVDEANKIKNTAARRGTKVHTICEDYVSNKPNYLASHMPNSISMFKQIQPWLDRNVNYVYNIEIPLHSHRLKTAGRCDLVANLHDYGDSIIDYKTSTKPKREEWIENYKLQTTAYAWMVYELYNIKIDHCVVLIAVETCPLQVFQFNPKSYYKKVNDLFTSHWESLMVDS